MKKQSSQFVCNQCGYESAAWYGKCPNCGSWNTMQEFRESKGKTQHAIRNTEKVKPVKLSEIKSSASGRISSGIEEFDRVLGGGFVAGEVILLAGEPGVGKSTLLLGLVKGMGELRGLRENSIFYVSGEESAEQVKMRAERLGVKGENLLLLAETNVERIIEEVRNEKSEAGNGSVKLENKDNSSNHPSNFNIQPPISNFQLLIIDSIQTLWSEDFEGGPGSVSQVKGCAQKLLEFVKKNNLCLILVGHVTKEGEVAGPMILSHMVDAVFFLEGERYADLRLLRGLKNRFGPTDEVGVFKLTEKGMEEVKDPSGLFLQPGEGEKCEVGSVTTCAMEGTRPMLVEIQALVTQSFSPMPRRVVSGVDYNRVLLLTAVLQKNLNIPLYNQDIYVKVGGGFKVSEPAADLGICLAIMSSFKNKSLPVKVCAFGEIGLLGEVRRVNGEEKRGKEAKKLGFRTILSSGTVRNLREAVKTIEK